MSSGDTEQCRLLATVLAASVERWQHFRTNSHPSFLRRIEQAAAERRSSSPRILETLWVRPYLREGETWPDLGPDAHTAHLAMFAAAPKLRRVSLGDDYSFDGDDLPIQLPWRQIERLDVDASFAGCMQLFRDCPKLAQLAIAIAQDCGVEGGADIVHHALRSLEIQTDDEPAFDCFFESVKLPALRDLRIHFALAWDFDECLTQARITAFLPTCSMLQRLVLRLYAVESGDIHDILRAVPPGLMELEICLEMDEASAIYTNALLEELTFNRGRLTPALLPNLHTLSLLGEGLSMDPAVFATMVRSRTKENANGQHGALLQSLYIHIVEDTESIRIQDLGEVKAILGDRADIRVVALGTHVSITSVSRLVVNMYNSTDKLGVGGTDIELRHTALCTGHRVSILSALASGPPPSARFSDLFTENINKLQPPFAIAIGRTRPCPHGSPPPAGSAWRTRGSDSSAVCGTFGSVHATRKSAVVCGGVAFTCSSPKIVLPRTYSSRVQPSSRRCCAGVRVERLCTSSSGYTHHLLVRVRAIELWRSHYNTSHNDLRVHVRKY